MEGERAASLSWAEERLLERHFARKIVEVYSQCAEQDPTIYTATAQATAIALFRRFFLSNTVVDFSPSLMLLAAILLAGKVEERRKEPARLLKLFGEELTVPQLVLYEAFLMEGCNFQFRVFHPYRPAMAFLGDFVIFLRRKHPGQPPDAARRLDRALRESCRRSVTNLLLSDAVFLRTPAVLALGALKYAIDCHSAEHPMLQGSFADYLEATKARVARDKSASLEQEIEDARKACEDAVAEEAEAAGEEGVLRIKGLRKKLRRTCRWKGDVPTSKKRKRKEENE
eukprot:scaffold2724_cov260-Pinguiococcus_pyrenoidosus.AAC.24